MKWSEQMRVLQSEDEHYNQLMLDTSVGRLYINEELISVLDTSETPYELPYGEFEKIKRKYPFFDDVKFLLNCIFFRFDNGDGYLKDPCIHYTKFNYVIKYDAYYELFVPDSGALLRIYFKELEIA